jgi:NAD(P)-dependent dehydrogenase (short-subunit alcohol dehydrogenase family)
MTGRVILVTGGAGGMGRAIAARFTAAGDHVVLADVRQDLLAAADAYERVSTLSVDVRDVDACDRMVESTVARHGRLDVLVCAAGVWSEGPSARVSEVEWDRVVDVNLKGMFFSCRAALSPLVRANGCVVAISSDYGLVGGPGAAVYCASKFGVNGLVRSLALELAPDGVRVNGVCPTDVDTPMLAGQARDFGGADPEAYLARLLGTLPQGSRARFIEPAEIAHAVIFLASPESAPITGVCLPIDWGVTAGY